MSAAWPESLFAAPILRNLDAGGRDALEGAGHLRRYAAGQRVFAAGEIADSFFVVHSGEVELFARTRQSLAEAQRLRMARAGETFGEEASAPGAVRQSEAVARTAVELAEIPAALFRRALGRSGAEVHDAPEQRLLRRRASADLLAQISLAERLPQTDFELLLDAVEHVERRRGERVYGVGERPDGLWLLVHGLVQLQLQDPDGSIRVQAYLSDGDFFGDAELLEDRPRALAAVATGRSQLLFVPPAAFRNLVDRNPALVGHLRRVADTREDRQAAAVEASPHATRHVFADLYRMRMARSLLTIDQDACVRCGHCAWSCEQVHGVARLVRRGDKVVTSLRVLDGEAPRELLLPNSCQHCKNPVCMIDCPTGAIGRDPEGEVFIREALCTGCGNCAKACPWENIRMAPRAAGRAGQRSGASEALFAPSLVAAAERKQLPLTEMFPEVATKCDLCREYEAPACVQSCPTEAIIRLEPERDFAEVAAVLALPEHGSAGAAKGPRLSLRGLGSMLVATAGAAGLALVIAALASAARLSPARGLGLAAGLGAALAMVTLAGHAVPKRLVKLWMRPKNRAKLRAAQAPGEPPPLARSRVRPLFRLHVGLGLVLPGLVLAHTGWQLPANLAGVLALLSWLSVALGMFGALSYAVIPRRLTRLEHAGALPEDLIHERERLLDRLQRELSGKSIELKQLCAEFLLPWARAPLGGLAMVLSGRDLAATRAHLREQLEARLAPDLRRGSDKVRAREQALVGLDPVIRSCVELRAVWARRVLTAALRGWLGPHIVITGALFMALAAHLWTVLR